MRCHAGDAVVGDEDVDVFLFVGAFTFPEASGVDENFLLRFGRRVGEVECDRSNCLCGTIDEAKLAVGEIEDVF